MRVSVVPQSHWQLVLLVCCFCCCSDLDFSHSNMHVVVSHCALICSSLIINDAEYFLFDAEYFNMFIYLFLYVRGDL